MTTVSNAGPAEGPFIWSNAKVLAVDVPMSGDVAAELLPAPLRPDHPPLATLFIADYPETQFGSVYREAGVLLHARDEHGPALHCSWMVVNDDAALILGREILGFPKKLAEITLERREAGVVGTVTRRGALVMQLEARLETADTDPAPMFGRRVVNAIGTMPTGMKLVELSPAAELIHSSRRGQARVTLMSSERDPLAELQVASRAEGRFIELDFGALNATPPRILGDIDPGWTQQRFFLRAL